MPLVVAVSPLSIFVTLIGPCVPAQVRTGRGSVTATICVPLTLIGCAAMPPMLTATGSLKPVPSIVTFVPPVAGPVSGPAAVICIFGTYRNPAASVVVVADVMLITFTATGPVIVPEPFGSVSRAVGAIAMI